MKPGALALCALVLFAGTARADPDGGCLSAEVVPDLQAMRGAALASLALAGIDGGLPPMPPTCGGGPVVMELGVPLPDGGVEDVPAAIHAGQVAPVDGVMFTVAENARRVAERAGDRAQLAAYEKTVTSMDAIPAWAWAAGAVIGGFAAAYVAVRVAPAKK